MDNLVIIPSHTVFPSLPLCIIKELYDYRIEGLKNKQSSKEAKSEEW
jgi:hypothetical protein